MLFSSIFYAIGAFVLASLLTILKTLFKPSHTRDDSKAWITFLFIFVIVMAGPYVFMEVMTKSKGPEMEKAIKEAYAASQVQGPMKYYKVRWAGGDSASVYIVGKELQSWGGYDYPVLALTMKKVDGKWTADSMKAVDFPRLNKDGIVFPPMW